MHVPLSPSSIIWYQPLDGKITAGLAESNGSLQPVTCGQTACTPGLAQGPTLGNVYGRTLPFLTMSPKVQPIFATFVMIAYTPFVNLSDS